MGAPEGPAIEGEGLIPEKLDERLQRMHEVIKAILSDDFSKNLSIHPRFDSFVPFERDMYNLVNKINIMNKQTETAIDKIREALSEIIGLTNTVKIATESIKQGKFDIPLEADSNISEIKELKRRFQYLISVIRLLSSESMLTDK